MSINKNKESKVYIIRKPTEEEYWWPVTELSEKNKEKPRYRNAYECTQILLREINNLGYSPEQIVWHHATDSLWGRTQQYIWPRNLEWKNLPLVANAEFEFKKHLQSGQKEYFSSNPFTSMNGKSYEQIQEETVEQLKNTRLFIIDHPVLRDIDVADLANSVEISQNEPQVFWFNGKELKEIGKDKLDAAKLEWSAHWRFFWSYILNARIMCARALLSAAEQTLTSRQVEKITKYNLGSNSLFSEQLWSPYTLQVLYYIESLGDKPAEEGIFAQNKTRGIEDRYTATAQLAKNSGLVEISEDMLRWVWKGTGSYPAYYGHWMSIDPGIEVSSLTEGYRPKGVVHLTGEEGYCIQSLESTRLICPGENGKFALTTTGKLYLKLLGSEANDPDVLLRWRKGENRICGSENIQAADRWLNRVFRSIKRNVSDLKLFQEKVVPVELEDSDINIKLILGRSLQFSLGDMAKENFPLQEVKELVKNPGKEVNISRNEWNITTLWWGIEIPKEDASVDEQAKLEEKAKYACSLIPPGIANWPTTAKFCIQAVC